MLRVIATDGIQSPSKCKEAFILNSAKYQQNTFENKVAVRKYFIASLVPRLWGGPDGLKGNRLYSLFLLFSGF